MTAGRLTGAAAVAKVARPDTGRNASCSNVLRSGGVNVEIAFEFAALVLGLASAWLVIRDRLRAS
jgi:hypothetical protein